MIDLETKEFIKTLTKRFIGMEVVNEKRDMVQVNSIVGPGGISVKNALRRMITIATTMLEDSLMAPYRIDQRMCDDIVGRDYDVNRLNLFIIRRCHEILEGKIDEEAEKRDVPDFLLFSRTVERIADHSKSIAANAVLLKGLGQLKKELEESGNIAVRLYKEATTAFFKNDADGANRVIDEARDMAEEMQDLKAQSVPVAYIIESMRRCFSYTSDLGEIVVNHSVTALAEKR
jgi:Na+/phosphate symporter